MKVRKIQSLDSDARKDEGTLPSLKECIGGSLLTSLFTFLLICIGLYVQKEKC